MFKLKLQQTFNGKIAFKLDSTNFFPEKYTCFFISNQVTTSGSNNKNGLKAKQLAKQPPTLKTLMQKILLQFWVKNLTFSILSSLALNVSAQLNCVK